MMKTAKMSGYSARMPGAFMVMYVLQKSSMCLPMSSSKVALHARATLDVPEEQRGNSSAEALHSVFTIPGHLPVSHL